MAGPRRGTEEHMVWWVFAALAVLVILGAALVLTGRVSAGSGDGPDATPSLPSGPWTAPDVEGLRFRVGLRGYRMSDVDAALAALAADLRTRDSQASTTEPGEPLGQ